MGLSHHGSSNHTCPMPSPLVKNADEPFIGGYTFYRFNMVLSGSCTAFAGLVVFVLLWMHATHLSKPNEQLKIMRICLLIPLYSVFAFMSICFPNGFVYLTPWLDVFQSIALGSFFLLLCEFILPSYHQRDVFFAALKVPHGKKHEKSGPISGLTWYRRRWIAIFQYPVVALVAAIATCITQAANVYCLESSKPYFAHLWINLAQTISVVVAVLSILRFYRVLRNELDGHQPLAKLLAFKLIVFLTFVQRTIFWILRSAKALNQSSKMTYADLNLGLPTMIICLEMVPFSVFFHYAYSVRPYVFSRMPVSATDHPYDRPQDMTYQGGFLGVRAWIAMLNPSEIIKAIIFAITMASDSRR